MYLPNTIHIRYRLSQRGRYRALLKGIFVYITMGIMYSYFYKIKLNVRKGHEFLHLTKIILTWSITRSSICFRSPIGPVAAMMSMLRARGIMLYTVAQFLACLCPLPPFRVFRYIPQQLDKYTFFLLWVSLFTDFSFPYYI